MGIYAYGFPFRPETAGRTPSIRPVKGIFHEYLTPRSATQRFALNATRAASPKGKPPAAVFRKTFRSAHKAQNLCTMPTMYSQMRSAASGCAASYLSE